MFRKKRLLLATAGAVAVGVAATVAVTAQATTQTNARLTARLGATSVEAQDPGYQYRAMPALHYAVWKDRAGKTHKRFVRSFQISPDADVRKHPQATRLQYHVGGALTDFRNWRHAKKAGSSKRLADSSEVYGRFAKLNNIFTARDGSLVMLDEQAMKDATNGRYLWRRVSRDGGASWSSTKARVDLAGAPVLSGAYGHAFQGVQRLPDGTLVMPFYVTHADKTDIGSDAGTETYMAAHLLISRDDGVSWKRASTVFKSNRNNYNESTVARRSDGRLIMITRYDVIQNGNTYSKLAYRVTSKPIRSGAELTRATWGKFTAVRVPGAADAAVTRGVAPVLKTMQNGILMLVFGRPRNKIAFSYDSGRTWTTARNLYDNIPASCGRGVPRGTTPQTYVPCSDLGSSGYMGVAVTSPRTAYILGDSCQAGWGCKSGYGRYPKGTTDKLWYATVRLA